TGVVCYRHAQFPEAYQGGFFLLDWTFGKVYFVSLQRVGAGYACQHRVFLEAVGDNGFAPTAAVVHPTTGDLYIAVGGRGTRGAVYRIRYPSRARAIDAAAVARLRVQPRSLDWQPALQKELLRDAVTGDAPTRLRALLAIRRHRQHWEVEQIHQAIRANWEHSDRSIRQATAALIASLDPAQRFDLLIGARTPFQFTTVDLATFPDFPEPVIFAANQHLVAKATPLEARLTSVPMI